MSATTNYAWTTPTVSGDTDTWGGIENTLAQSIDTELFRVEGLTSPSGIFSQYYAVDSGSANHIVVAFTPDLSDHTAGLPLRVKVQFANTGTTDFDPGPGPKTVVDEKGSVLENAALRVDGIYTLTYDPGHDNYQITPSFRRSVAAEVTAGTSTQSAIPPAYLPYAPNVVHAACLVTTDASGVPALSVAALNVVSVSKIGTGHYRVTFDNSALVTWGIPTVTCLYNATRPFIAMTDANAASPTDPLDIYFYNTNSDLSDPISGGFTVMVL